MAQSGSPPPFPTTEMSSETRKKQKQEDEQGKLQAAASIPEGPLLEILSRVPYRSLCRFKCVSKPWFALCSDPQVCKRCPQTLSGFFYKFMDDIYNFFGRGPPMVDPSLPFLRMSYERVILEDCCGGLVLCRCWKSDLSDIYEYDLVVCNPATEEWTKLPPGPIKEILGEDEHYLAFDPAIPSRFVVFSSLFGVVAIYSSDTGRWTMLKRGGIHMPYTGDFWECVFLNGTVGTMHLLTDVASILTVDTEGKVCREIDFPDYDIQSCVDLSIGRSQGRLYAWYVDDPNVCQLSVWALDDYDSAKWTLKHTVNILELFERHGYEGFKSYKMHAIHPDCNVIFLADVKNTISYDMDNQEVHVIDLPTKTWVVKPYIPYFGEWPSDGH